MIHRIVSDAATFKPIRFHRGLNMLVAEKTRTATDRQTRNGAGKSSLIELIHFALGTDCGRGCIFRNEALSGYRFGIEMDIGESRVKVSRSGSKPSSILVTDLDTGAGPGGETTQQGLLKEAGFEVNDWRDILGERFFGLPSADRRPRFGPTFRSLFPYFARRQASGGFDHPERHNRDQQLSDQQVAVSYLLGLDWNLPRQLQEVREKEKTIRQPRKAAKEGTLGRVIPSAAELWANLTLAERRVHALKERIDTFVVLPEYSEREQEAAELTQRMGTLADENTADRLLIEDLEQAMATEAPPPATDVDRLYAEAGIVLPDSVARRFDEVRRFHASVVDNRRSHLSGEVQGAERRIAEREREQAELDRRRARIMDLLRAHGALDQLTQLQNELSRVEAQAEPLRQALDTAERVESTAADVKIERAALYKRLQDDYHDEHEVIEEAVVTFAELSAALYERPGTLTVDPTENGPVFRIDIPAHRSSGISRMQVFCFDLMLAELWTRRGLGPGFLIHDSHLFDGVDGRQVGKALRLGAARAAELGFQYIVTLNSDELAKAELPAGFDVRPHLLDVELTDASETGGLFGLRFD
jgi:uncharacterized protein YydD (DUF2326 family)